MLFTDTITIFNKTEIDDQAAWTRTVVEGVQFSDRYEKVNTDGRISVARYCAITIPHPKYEGLVLRPENEDDAIFYGIIDIDETPVDVRGYRVSDLMIKYPRSGRIKSVNDNTNRTHLKNVKVVIA